MCGSDVSHYEALNWRPQCAALLRWNHRNKMKDENNDRFNFLSVTMDSKSKVNRLLEKHDFNFDHIVGSEKLTSKLGFRHFPYNIFLDKEGRIKVIDGGVPVKYENGISAPCPDRFLKILESLL